MECQDCRVKKLPNEFPPEPVTDKCCHVQQHCMRCVLKSVREKAKCPHQNCGANASLDDPKPKLFRAILNTMFRQYDAVYTPEVVHPLFQSGTLTITLLTGESIQMPYDPNMRITALKENIHAQLKHETYKQKLLYNEVEITDYKNGSDARLIDFGVPANASLFLVIVLFAIPDTFDDVVFDLFWGYPSSGRDYLDASCLLFNRQSLISVCDFRFTYLLKGVIKHSGDVMDHHNKIGHHTINVALKSLPPDITHLFFTLSAWRSPNISKYPNPSLKFYEASKPGKDLCKTTFSHANYSQAVIMCSVSRGNDGKWKIFESGKLSSGNAKDYSPIEETIRSLIAKGI